MHGRSRDRELRKLSGKARNIRDMNQTFAAHQSVLRATGLGTEWLPQHLGNGLRNAMSDNGSEVLAIIRKQAALRGTAEAMRLLQDRVEHRREIAGRRIDHLQYFGSRGLLLQGLARFCDQPRILHCNDRLGREVLDQCDLLVCKRPDLRACRDDHPQERFIFPQRNRRRVRLPASTADRAIG